MPCTVLSPGSQWIETKECTKSAEKIPNYFHALLGKYWVYERKYNSRILCNV